MNKNAEQECLFYIFYLSMHALSIKQKITERDKLMAFIISLYNLLYRLAIFMYN